MRSLDGITRLVAAGALALVALVALGRPEAALAAPPAAGVGVFVVTSGELRNGLVEKEEADSRKDLEGKLRQGRKNIRLAPSREAAHLVLVIGGRGVADSGAYIPGSTTTTVQANTYGNNLTATARTTTNPDIPILVTNVRADLYLSADGRHLRGFLGDGLTWKGAANDVAKQVDSWVGLNQQALERMVEQARMAAVEAAFKARHPDLTPDVERQIVELGNSGEILPTATMTPDQYLEKLYETVMARRAATDHAGVR